MNQARKLVEEIRRCYPAIEQEISLSKPKHDQFDPSKAEEEISRLKEVYNELKKRVNMNIELMYEKTEKQHQEILIKRQTLFDNKEQL